MGPNGMHANGGTGTSSPSHALDAPPWQRVETTLMAAARDLRAAYNQAFEPLGLNMSQASMLGYIAGNGPMNQTQLAAALALGRAATGTVVDQLEARGLVQRVPDPDDRRVWVVQNTPPGAEMVDRIRSIDEDLRDRFRCGISRAERQRLADVLIRMSANVAAILCPDKPDKPEINQTSSTKQETSK